MASGMPATSRQMAAMADHSSSLGPKSARTRRALCRNRATAPYCAACSLRECNGSGQLSPPTLKTLSPLSLRRSRLVISSWTPGAAVKIWLTSAQRQKSSAGYSLAGDRQIPALLRLRRGFGNPLRAKVDITTAGGFPPSSTSPAVTPRHFEQPIKFWL